MRVLEEEVSNKPVGTIWTAYYIKGEVYTKLLRLKGSREENRLEASRLALEEVILYTEKIMKMEKNMKIPRTLILTLLIMPTISLSQSKAELNMKNY